MFLTSEMDKVKNKNENNKLNFKSSIQHFFIYDVNHFIVKLL